ncbi:MAG: lipocalin family protein [Xanthomonadales bacterium]|nr:lipocalin family protein [Xanthomonadales bacterium]
MLASSGCARASQPIAAVEHVDMSRYMGRWYVIASIPTRFERHGYNMVETYRRMPNGNVCTSLWFHEDGFNGPVKKLHSVASVVQHSGHARWKVHLFWLLREQYIVAWLKPDYSQVIVARDKRDYVWLMARTPRISAADYQAMLARVKAMGYDMSTLHKVPQQWPQANQGHPSFEESCE